MLYLLQAAQRRAQNTQMSLVDNEWLLISVMLLELPSEVLLLAPLSWSQRTAEVVLTCCQICLEKCRADSAHYDADHEDETLIEAADITQRIPDTVPLSRHHISLGRQNEILEELDSLRN